MLKCVKEEAMKNSLVLFCLFVFGSLQSPAAVLHFYSNPQVPQPLFHVTLEYQDFVYEADTREGGRRLHVSQIAKKGDFQILISDSLVNVPALQSQLGLAFDYQFIWGNDKTYCSELVGIALGMEPQPMSFAGTHYLKYYPEWIHRNDPGLSPDQIYEFGLQHGILLQN